MDEQFFDNLAKGLDDGTVSQGQTLKLAGAALLSSFFASQPGLSPLPRGSRLEAVAATRTTITEPVAVGSLPYRFLVFQPRP